LPEQKRLHHPHKLFLVESGSRDMMVHLYYRMDGSRWKGFKQIGLVAIHDVSDRIHAHPVFQGVKTP